MELPLPSTRLSNESNLRKNRFDGKLEEREKDEEEPGSNEGIRNRKMRKGKCCDSRVNEVVGNRKECCSEEDNRRSNQSRSRDRR